MTSDLIFAVWLLLLGAVGGSAIGAFVDRFAAGRSWLWGRSACMSCGQRIAAADLVPIVSYLRLRGRCRACNAPLPRHLLVVELVGVGCAFLALLLGDGRAEQLAGTLFLLLLLGLFLCDARTMRLPDVLTGAMAIVGLWVGTLWRGLPMSALSAVIGVAAFYALSKGYAALRGRAGLGMGDVKMMAGLGAMSGPLGLPWLTLIAAAAALVVAAFRAAPVNATTRIALGCYLAVAGAFVWAMIALGLV